ncbi:MAG: hypothetical protein FJ267_14960, partial [Planctomycetes bacterium]|nr:hypothetical protein [Planctomycetota bacterium]
MIRKQLLLIVVVLLTSSFAFGQSNTQSNPSETSTTQSLSGKGSDPLAAGEVQPPFQIAVWDSGYELFQMLLEDQGLVPAKSMNQVAAAPTESVIVVMGNLEPLRNMSTGSHSRTDSHIVEFIHRGGTVLIAANRSQSLESAGEFHAGPVTSNHPSIRYRKQEDYLRITDIARSHPLLANVNEIIVSQTGWFSLVESGRVNWKVVARAPKAGQPMESRRQPIAAVGTSVKSPDGVMILFADPHLFTNEMIWHGDNSILAVRTSELLVRSAKKRSVLFLVDGKVLP